MGVKLFTGEDFLLICSNKPGIRFIHIHIRIKPDPTVRFWPGPAGPNPGSEPHTQIDTVIVGRLGSFNTKLTLGIAGENPEFVDLLIKAATHPLCLSLVCMFRG